MKPHELLAEAIINSPHDVIIGTDLSGRVTTWNAGAENVLGYAYGEIKGQLLSMLVPVLLLAEEESYSLRIRDGNYVDRYHTRWRRKDGATVHLSFTIVPVRDDKGAIAGACHIGRDITASKLSEERSNIKVKDAEETLERMNDGFIMLDRNYCYRYLNTKVGEMIGMRPDSLVGRCVWDVFPDAVDSPTFRALRVAMEEQRYVYNLDYYPPLDLWQENHVYPTQEGLSVFIRDISDQKRAEEKIRLSEKIYKTIASGIPGSVISIFDKDYRYKHIEGDILHKLGFTKEALLGKKAIDVLPPERYERVLPSFLRVFSGESFTIEDSRPDVDTMSRWAPLRDENNVVTSAIVVVIDVSALKNAHRAIVKLNVELEQKVAERTAELAEVNRELESFTYSVAHDLRTPLRAIGGYSTMLLEEYHDLLDDEGKRLLANVDRNAKKMGVLIDELLSFSRLGRKMLVKSIVDMNVVFNAAVAAADCNPDRIISIQKLDAAFADAAMIKFVAANLLSNAIKYSSREKNPRVDISSYIENGQVVYTVADNGVGFDMAFADKLFGVFQRLHANSDFEGTGVGLAIVHRIIERHDGKVWASSEPGKGARFYFSLPVQTLNN